MFFHWNMNDSKSSLVPRTLQSVLVDFDSAEVWMVLVLLFISNSFSHLSKSLDTIPSTPMTIYITVIFMLHSLFNFLAKSNSIFLLSFMFIYGFHFLRQILVCIYTICQYDQVLTSCTILAFGQSLLSLFSEEKR